MITATPKRISRCRVCGAWINLEYGKESPAKHAGHSGTKDDPRSPGDWNDICDVCCYDPDQANRRGKR